MFDTEKSIRNTNTMVPVGYQGDSSNYGVYYPESIKITMSRDVIFNEDCMEVTTEQVSSENKELFFPARYVQEKKGIKQTSSKVYPIATRAQTDEG